MCASLVVTLRTLKTQLTRLGEGAMSFDCWGVEPKNFELLNRITAKLEGFKKDNLVLKLIHR